MTERAQLLLVGAFVLAVALIGLTVVLNAGSYTTTLASQENAVSSGSDAVATRLSVRAELATMLAHVNRGTSDDYGTRSDRFVDQLQWVANATRDHYARRGRLVNASAKPIASPTSVGTRIRQPTTANFNDPAAPSNAVFDIADNVYTRNVTFVLTDVRGDSGTPFKVVLGDPPASAAWELRVYTDGSGVHFETQLLPSGPTRECVVPESYPIAVDVDEGTINDRYCPAFEHFGDSLGRYDVDFRNGNTVSGRYWLTVDQAPGPVLVDSSAASDSEQEEVVYSTTVRFRYHSSTVAYETDLRVAPGELRGS